MEQKCFASATLFMTIFLGIVEWIWLKHIKQADWLNQVKLIQKSPMNYRLNSAIFTYIIMLLCLNVLAVSRIDPKHLVRDSVIYGGFTGLAMYGVFNGVNYAIFKNYGLNMAITDTVYGVLVCILTSMIGAYAANHIKFYKMLSINL
jgi:uncharacterized membrane protein